MIFAKNLKFISKKYNFGKKIEVYFKYSPKNYLATLCTRRVHFYGEGDCLRSAETI